MDAEPGLCFIFHNHKFEKHASLTKSFDIVKEENEKALNENFVPFHYENFSSSLIVHTIKDVAENEEFYNYSRFKFVFVTHGGRYQKTNKSVIFGSNSKPIDVHFIFNLLSDVNCINLTGKHKEFHFFTCDCVYPPVDEKHVKTGLIEIGNGHLAIKNIVRDMIKMWSTVDGFVSYRRQSSGSDFIRSLCEAITEHKETKGIIEILQRVQIKVDNYRRDETQVTELQKVGFRKNFYFPTASAIQRDELLGWYAYEMKRPSAGTCLIININKYETKKKIRFGSEVDVINLETVFKNLSYNVITETDLTADEINEKVKDTLSHHTTDIDSFVLILMAHGTTRYNGSVVVYGVDGNQVHINDISQLFNDLDCSNLRGKPKLLFFNCCRGFYDTRKPDNVESEPSNTEEAVKSDCWDHNEKYKATSDQWQIRDTLYSFGDRVLESTMRDMILGTRIAENLLNNFLTMPFQVADLEYMQLMNLISTIEGKITHSLPEESSAIGLRKIIYPFRLFGDIPSKSRHKRIAVIVDNSTIWTNFSIEHYVMIYKKLNFKVVYLENQTKEQILDLAVEYSSNSKYSKYDCFVFYFVGKVVKNGKHNIIYGFDKRKVNSKQIMHMFNDDDCPSWKGKPKIFSFTGDDDELVKAEDRSDDEIMLCKEMEEILGGPMHLTDHLSGGCKVQFHTPFAVFETINDYINQESYIVKTAKWFDEAVEKLLDILTANAVENVIDFLVTISGSRNVQQNRQINAIDVSLTDIVQRALCSTASEITPRIKFDYAELAGDFKCKRRTVKKLDRQYYEYEFRETLFSFSETHHRDRKSKCNTNELTACYCQWSTN